MSEWKYTPRHACAQVMNTQPTVIAELTVAEAKAIAELRRQRRELEEQAEPQMGLFGKAKNHVSPRIAALRAKKAQAYTNPVYIHSHAPAQVRAEPIDCNATIKSMAEKLRSDLIENGED